MPVLPWYVIAGIVALSLVLYLAVGIMIAAAGHINIKRASIAYRLQDVDRLNERTIIGWPYVLLINACLSIEHRIVGEDEE